MPKSFRNAYNIHVCIMEIRRGGGVTPDESGGFRKDWKTKCIYFTKLQEIQNQTSNRQTRKYGV